MTVKTLVLLRPLLLTFKNSVSLRGAFRRLPFIILAVGFWVIFFFATHKGLSYLRNIGVFGELVAGKVVYTVFFGLMGFLFLSNIITAISSFYLSRDLPLLRTPPVPVKELMSLKAVETVLNSSWMVFSFVSPVLLAFGTAYRAPFYYYPLVAVSFLFFSLIASGAGISAAHILTRLFPAKRLKEAFLFSGLMLFLSAYFLFRHAAPTEFNSPLEFIEAVTFDMDFPLVPGYWMSSLTLSMMRGDSVEFLNMSLLISNGLFLMMAAMAIGGRLYGGNLERLQGSRSTVGFGIPWIYSGRWTSLMFKDLAIFSRDVGQWSQLLVILSLTLVYVYNFKAIPLQILLDVTPLAKEALVFANLILSGLILAAVAGRFLYSSVSLEGQAFWVIRSSPVGMKRFLIGKFVSGLIPLTVVTMITAAVTNLIIEVRGLLMYLTLGTVFVLSFSISALGTGFGALYPKFKYDNISSVSMSLGGMAFMLAAFGVSFVTVIAEAWPVYLFYKTGRVVWISAIVSVVFIMTFNFLTSYLPLKAGIRKCTHLEE